jgi:hypothetical protein
MPMFSRRRRDVGVSRGRDIVLATRSCEGKISGRTIETRWEAMAVAVGTLPRRLYVFTPERHVADHARLMNKGRSSTQANRRSARHTATLPWRGLGRDSADEPMPFHSDVRIYGRLLLTGTAGDQRRSRFRRHKQPSKPSVGSL